MEQSINKALGHRIRALRKSAGYKLVTFARELHRGKSVVSKYERGEVSIDITTLKQIADVLGISISALLADIGEPGVNLFTGAGTVPEDGSYETMYMYMYAAHRGRPTICRNVAHIYDNSVSIYAELADERRIEDYKSFYHGIVHRETSFVRGLLTNPVIEHDIVMFEYQPPLKKRDYFYGFFCTLSIGHYFPFATKALFSYAPIDDDAWIIDHLRITAYDTRRYRQQNGFFILESGENTDKESGDTTAIP